MLEGDDFLVSLKKVDLMYCHLKKNLKHPSQYETVYMVAYIK